MIPEEIQETKVDLIGKDRDAEAGLLEDQVLFIALPNYILFKPCFFHKLAEF